MNMSGVNDGKEFQNFLDKLLKRLNEYYGEQYSITFSEVVKNNNSIRHSLLIRKDNERLTPSIYIDEFYERYQGGDTFAEIAADIIALREAHNKDVEIDIGFVESYESVKPRLIIKLVNRELNYSLLTESPHWDFADLSVLFCIAVENEHIGKGTILIRNDLFEAWGITVEKLFVDARENMMKKYPPYMVDIVDLLIEMYKERNDDGTASAKEEIDEYTDNMGVFRDENKSMYVLTNEAKWYGASVIIYPEMLQKLGDTFASDYYLLPSSIHEVIVIPSRGVEDAAYLTEMVMEVNKSQVEWEEVLANHAYCYHRANNWLEPLTSNLIACSY